MYKPEHKLMVKNYRPISVLPALSKIMERVLHHKMSAYLDRFGFLYGHPYGLSLNTIQHSKSERSVLALKIGPIR